LNVLYVYISTSRNIFACYIHVAVHRDKHRN